MEVKGTCGKTCKLYAQNQIDGKIMNTYIAKKAKLENKGTTHLWKNREMVQWYTSMYTYIYMCGKMKQLGKYRE